MQKTFLCRLAGRLLPSRNMIFKTLFVMRLTFFLILAATLQIAAKGISQNITWSGKDVPLEHLFTVIKQQTGYMVLYNYNTIKKAPRVSMNATAMPLKQFLDKALSQQQLKYVIRNNSVFISDKSAETGKSIDLSNWVPAPVITVTGSVTDPSGLPLSGVAVKVRGTTAGWSTKDDGSFSATVNTGAVLEISYVGYQTIEVTVHKAVHLTLTMQVNVGALDETVIKGYYTTSKRLNTGSVSTVKSEDIAKQPVNNVLAALQGRVPGMIVTQNTGVPGGSFTVQIRGRNSILKGNEPLYIIDGVPYVASMQNFLGNTFSDNSNPLNYIDPAGIDRVDVLKDADATAIYGSRAANGVVFITTKKGAAGNMKADFNVYHGIARVTRQIEMMNSQQYVEMREEAFKNDGITPNTTNAVDLKVWDPTRYTNLQDVMIGGTAQYTNAQVALTGGSEQIQYRLGAGYHRETSVFPGSLSNGKGSLNFSLNTASANRKFKIQLSGNYVLNNENLLNWDITQFAFTRAPTMPEFYNPDGSLNWANSTWTNPLNNLEQRFSNRINNLVSNAVVSYQLLPELELKASGGYTNLLNASKVLTPSTYSNPATSTGVANASLSSNNLYSWIAEPQLQFKKRIAKGSFNMLAGASFQRNYRKLMVVRADNIPSDALINNLRLAPSASIAISSLADQQYNFSSLFGRLNYDWENKYLINITARRDGSTRFGPGNRFAVFGAAGIGWIFTQESFVKNALPFLSFGKLRASYGTSGNDQIGEYQYEALYNPTAWAYQNSVGLVAANLDNRDFAWELNKKLEAAIELGFWQDRLTLTAGFYTNRSSNQLVGMILPPTTGFASVTANLPATIENKGWEFAVNGSPVKSAGWNWNSSFNITIPRNKLVAFPGLETSTYASTYVIGQPISINKVYEYTGVNPQTGLYSFRDAKGNITSSPASASDRTQLINTDIRWYGGWQNEISYKRFSIDFLFQFVKQLSADPRGLFQINPGVTNYNMPVTVLNRWQKDGDIAENQKFSTSTAAPFTAFNAWRSSNGGYADGSFVRLKNVSLSWQLPVTWQQAMKAKQLRIYVQGQNLFVITSYKGMDPENRSISALPPLKVLTAGIQVTL